MTQHDFWKKTPAIMLLFFGLTGCFLASPPRFSDAIPDGDFAYTDNDFNLWIVDLSDGEKQVFDLSSSGLPLTRPSLSSRQGDQITTRVSRFNPNAGVPAILNKDGSITWCGNYEYPGSIGRIWFHDEGRVISILKSNDSSPDKIILFNLMTCEVERILFTVESTGDIRLPVLEDLAVRNDGWLAVVRRTLPDQGFAFNTTLLISPDGIVRYQLTDVYCPGWSFDSRYMTFVKEDNIYLGNEFGKDAAIIVEGVSGSDCPSWHPFSNLILYGETRERQTSIYLFDIENRVEYDLGYEGFLPFWLSPGFDDYP